jgi:hypothetical protein
MRLMEVASKPAGNPSVMNIGFWYDRDGLDICSVKPPRRRYKQYTHTSEKVSGTGVVNIIKKLPGKRGTAT